MNKDGSWERVFGELVRNNRQFLDLSVAHFDGTHIRAHWGEEVVSYQGRKKARTSNTLWLIDNQGLAMAFTPLIASNHYDTFAIKKRIKGIISKLKNVVLNLMAYSLMLMQDGSPLRFDSEVFRREVIC